MERLDHYIHDLPREDEYIRKEDPDVKDWPETGEIMISNLDVRYPSRPDYSVIENVTLGIRTGKKVGVVGRTGSGKSTLVSVLFRLMESSNGSITVDGKGIARDL